MVPIASTPITSGISGVQERYLALWGRRGQQRVCLPQPISLDKDTVHHLETEPYMVSYKTDGDRRALYADAGQHVFYWVDRHDTFTAAPGTASTPNVFVGTVLDGEYVPGGGESGAPSTFVVFDCVALTGTTVARQPLPRRLLHAATACRLIRLEGVQLRVKTTLMACDLAQLLKLPDPDGVPHDGLIFTPVNCPVVSAGNKKKVFKWKSPSEHTVDLWCRDLRLYAEDRSYNGSLVDLARSSGGDEALGRALLEALPVGRDVLLECRWCSRRRSFVPKLTGAGALKTRPDKPRANSMYVVQQTLKAIEDNLTRFDLLQLRFIRA